MRPFALALALLAAVPQAARAGKPTQDREELRHDRRELRQDRNERRDDVRDLRRLEALLLRFDQARRARDEAGLRAVESALRSELSAERGETRRELARDRAEIARDRQDLAAGGHALRDDARDARVEAAVATRRSHIAAELERLRGRFSPPILDHKRMLILELIRLARGEVIMDGRELREDRPELRGDGRAPHDGPRH